MQVVLGGYAQGKLNIVLESLKCDRNEVLIIDEKNYKEYMEIQNIQDFEGFRAVVVNHLHLIIKETAEREVILSWTEKLISLCSGKTELIFISNELGCGIVPVDKMDRELREDNGRVLCILAAKAQKVTRIIAGIAMVIKQDQSS